MQIFKIDNIKVMQLLLCYKNQTKERGITYDKIISKNG